MTAPEGSTKQYNVLSLGAGVQSTVLALMASRGEIEPTCDFAVFADPGWEGYDTYDHLDWLEEQLDYPLYTTSNGSIYKDVIASASEGKRMANPPYYTLSKDGKKGVLKRGCTTEYKVIPVQRKVREILGFKKGERIAGKVHVNMWLGISTDESQRLRESTDKWITFRWPLIEKGMNRTNCQSWLEKNGYPEAPRSACVGCPYHNNDYWRDMKKNRPDEWDEACKVDDLIRNGINKGSAKDFQADQLFTHNDMVPLREVDLSTDEDRGQMTWLDECSGNCFL